MQKTQTVQTDTSQNHLLLSKRHVDVFFCARCCHKVLSLIIKLVVAGVTISHQFRCGLILETNVSQKWKNTAPSCLLTLLIYVCMDAFRHVQLEVIAQY